MHGIKPEKLIPAQETNLIKGTLILIWLIMNYTTIKLSYKCFCKNINHLFFFFCLQTLFLVWKSMHAESLKVLFWEEWSIQFPNYPLSLSVLEVLLIYIFKLHLSSSWPLFFLHVRIHNFRSLHSLWDWHMELHRDGFGNSSVPVAVGNLTHTAAFGIAQVEG